MSGRTWAELSQRERDEREIVLDELREDSVFCASFDHSPARQREFDRLWHEAVWEIDPTDGFWHERVAQYIADRW